MSREYLTGEYQRRLTEIEEHNPEDENQPDIRDSFKTARNLLFDLDDIENDLARPHTLIQESLDISEEIPTRQWLIKYWLPVNCLSMITGEGGVGKSYAALQIAAAITCNVHDDHVFLPKPAGRDTPLTTDRAGNPNVVYAAWEDENDEVRRRLQYIHNELQWVNAANVQARLTFIDMKGFGPIWGPAFGDHISTRARMLPPGYQLTKICEDTGASLLILDPGAGAFGGNENDRAAVREYAAYLNAWGQEKECATLILAHPPKTKSEGTGDYSGTTDWLGSVRSLWNIAKRPSPETKEQKKAREEKGEPAPRYHSIQHQKSNYAKLQPERYMTKAENNGVWIEVHSGDDAKIDQSSTTQEENTDVDDTDILGR